METIFESKLNTMSIQELELIDTNTFSVIINKLLNISRPTKNQMNSVIALGNRLASIDDNKPVYRKKAKHIYWSNSKQSWIAQRNINGKNVWIKQNQDKEIVKQAYLNFCIERGLKP